MQNVRYSKAVKIKVIGVGTGGCKTIDRIIESGIVGVEFWAIDTDARVLSQSDAPNSLQIGNGFGAEGNPAIGQKAAKESRAEIATVLKDTDLVFIVAGMGRGTGTGAAPIVARVAQEMGCLTVALITRPFTFEGRRCYSQADEGINNLETRVDTAIVISNDRLLSQISPEMPLQEVFRLIDDILCQGVQAILNPIAIPSLVDLDFMDVRQFMTDAGLARMGIGSGSGKSKAADAAAAAISSPLLESSIERAKRILFNVTGGTDLSLYEVNAAAETIYERVDPNASIWFGATIDEQLQGKVKITGIIIYNH